MKKQGVNPTKQHSMKCPKLYGKKCTCDGYHTFDELYEHRIALFIALCKGFSILEDLLIEQGELHPRKVNAWKSKYHSDGTNWEGWFILGLGKEKGKQITYHLPVSYWDKTEFVQMLDKAPEWDGHTSEDVIKRLLEL